MTTAAPRSAAAFDVLMTIKSFAAEGNENVVLGQLPRIGRDLIENRSLPAGHYLAARGRQQVALVPVRKSVGYLQTIIKEMFDRANDLVVLMTLAGNEQAVSRSSQTAGSGNGLSPVADHRVPVERRCTSQ